MKRRTRNNRQRQNALSFQKLEPRQLLAGDLVGAHQVDTSLPTGANIVVNGDFEAVVAGDDNFFNESEITAWKGIDSSNGQQFNVFDYSLGSQDSTLAVYGNVLDIDSKTADFDRVYQDLNTEAETEYLLTFDYRRHTVASDTASAVSQDFEVWWNFELVGRFTGGEKWNTGVIKVTSSALDLTQLLFCEITEVGAPGGDGIGALLDNVRVVKATEVAIENGSFENKAEDRTLFYRPQDVPGWSAIAADVNDRFLKIATSDVSETPEPGSAVATDGGNYLNLDTTKDHRDVVFTNLETVAGETYYVTFDLRTNGDQAVSSDELRVRWNDAWASTIIGHGDWSSHALLVTATSESTQLAFLEPGESTGNGSGPLIDNVRVYSVAEVATPDDNLVVDLNGDETGTTGSANFFPNAGAQPIGQTAALSRSFSSNLTSATVELSGTVNGGQEVIGVLSSAIPNDESGNPKIALTTYNSATGELLLTGSASVEEYEAVLKTLTYFNAATNVGTSPRTVRVTIEDNTLPAGEQTASAVLALTIETDQANIDEFIMTNFIADNNLNATKVQDGLYVVIDEPGTGDNPTLANRVRVKYDGKVVEVNDQNRTVGRDDSFDTSSEDGVEFPLTGVIEGWRVGIPQFKVGGQGKLIIASDLAYGQFGNGPNIPPNSVLVFDIDLKEIVS
ncbi:MAG: FKBP-type peptidyl-prolyl cis-trans isomerase [Mariniblastus sp.]